MICRHVHVFGSKCASQISRTTPTSTSPRVRRVREVGGNTAAPFHWAAPLQASSGNGLFGTAENYFKTFRLKAAETLTSSLPEEERKQLIEKVVPDSKKDDEDAVKEPTGLGGAAQASIDEMVAMARAEEAERLSHKFEEEKESLKQEMEEAAWKRVESDLELQKRRISFERWKNDLEKEKQTEHELGKEAVSEAEEKAMSTSAAADGLGEHPLLGPVLYDLGHKRIHIVAADRLTAMPVWEKQRFFRSERAKSMAKDKAKSLHIGLPGIIGIYESNDGSLAIIDGQHRVGMLKELAGKHGVSDQFDLDRILVEVYPQPQESGDDPTAHATEIFKEINKAQPANLVDLPGVVDASTLSMINEAAKSLAGTYPDMFSPSQKCKRPHLNEDNLRNEIFLAGVIENLGIKTSKALEEWILTQNETMTQKYETDTKAQEMVPNKALEKARKHGFFLGLDTTWYNN